MKKKYEACGLGTYLFVKVPRPGDSEEKSCHLLPGMAIVIEIASAYRIDTHKKSLKIE